VEQSVLEIRPVGGLVPYVDGDPRSDEMIPTGEAAEIVGRTPRTVERWVDARVIRGGRPTDPESGEPLTGKHRWVDARHAVEIAVAGGRAHLVPAKWRHLIPLPDLPMPRTEPQP
jgi:hypothetical protein